MRKIIKLYCFSFLAASVFLTFCSTISFAQSTDSTNNVKNTAPIVTDDSTQVDSIQVNLSDELKSKVHYPAYDSIIYDVENEKVYLFNQAEIEYEDLKLKANYIEIDWNTRMLYATGGPDSSGKMAGFPQFVQGSDKFDAATLSYNFDTKKGKITKISTQQGEGFLHGDTVRKTAFDDFYVKNGKYTTCDNPHPHFYIGANKLKVIKNDKIVTGPAYLVLADVPTPIAIPFGFFPNKRGRNSGILIPVYGESNDLGFFLKDGGYYFGFSDYIDLSLTGDIYSLGSWGLHGESRYSNRYHYSGNLRLDYSKFKISQPELPDYSVNKSFMVNWSHYQDPKAKPNSSFTASVRFGSSDYYANNISTSPNNFNNAVDYLTSTYVSSIAYSKNWPGKPFNFTISGRHNQNIQTHAVNITLPELSFGVNRINPFKRKNAVGKELWYEKLGTSLTMSARNELNTFDSLVFKKGVEKYLNNGIAYAIPFSTSFKVLKYFNVSPSLNYNERWYFRTIEKYLYVDSNKVIVDTIDGFKTARNISASIALNTRIYGMFNFKHGKLAAIRHVITPSVSFSFRPDYSNERYSYYKTYLSDTVNYRETKYSIFEGAIYGGPESGKYGFMSFGFDNNFEMKVRQVSDTAVTLKKKRLLESLSINSGYNFAVDSFNWSPISIGARTTVFEILVITGNMSLDQYALNDDGIRIAKTMWDDDKKVGRLTSASVTFNFPISNNAFNKKSQEAETVAAKPKPDNAYFGIPWNFNVGYTFNYSKPGTEKYTVQTLNFYGDFDITPKWKINFASGYDFEQKDLTYTSVGFVRDLHCWEMRLNWVPFGGQENYFFQINVKSGVLRDLKFTKKRDIYD